MVYKRQLFFQYSRPSGCDTSKLLSDDLKNKLYYDGFQKMLYHYSHHKTVMKKMSQSFFFVVASKIGDFANRFLNTVLQCCPTIFGRFAHPEAHFLCHFLEFGRGVGNFFEKKQNKSCCFQNVFNFPVAIPEPGSFDRRAHQRPDEPDDP